MMARRIARDDLGGLPRAVFVAFGAVGAPSFSWEHIAIAVRSVQREALVSVARPSTVSLIKAPPPNPSFKGLELDYERGDKFYLSAEFLRVKSPSADSMRMMANGKRKVISGRRHVHILQIEPVGKYGIRIIYDDTHDTGIYTWGYLHDLGSNKFSHMRSYIRSLREQGLNRDPVRGKG